jgi:hypothetical protein
MMPDEVLAVCRLRQWAADRAGQVTNYQREGWRERRTRDSNARIVRVIDFERALSRLTEEHQAILLLTYREHQPQDRVSILTGVSVRALSYKLPAARQALAKILDLLDLLLPAPGIKWPQVGMTLRSVPDTIESLRVILQEVEQTIGEVHDSADLAELKRILLDRIAELEIAQARTAEPAVNKIYKLAS